MSRERDVDERGKYKAFEDEPLHLIWQAPDLPSITILRSKYRRLGLFDWDTLKVNLLCRQIKCAPEEVCAAAGMFDMDRVAALKKRNRPWPVYMAIHFKKIEDLIHRMKFKFEPVTGPGPEDIEMARLIARGMISSPKDVSRDGIPNHVLDLIAGSGCKATTETLKP